MSDTNPQVTPVQGTDNAQGISIDTVLSNQGNPMPENAPVPPVTPTPETPPANQPPAPETVPPVTTPPVTPETPAEPVDEFERVLLSADGLSAEDLQLRNNMLTRFGAVNTDAKGNLLDAQNRVVLSRANLDKFIDTGDVLQDAQGNQVNEFGEVIASAEQVVATNSFVNNARTAIEEEFGFQFLDAEGKPKVYDNSSTGNLEFVKDAITNTHYNAVANFLNSNDELKQIFFHLQNGGTIENYVNESFDYTKVDVASLSREQKLNYIKTSFEKQGLKNASSTLKLLESASEEAVTEATSDALLALNGITEDARTQAEQEYQRRVEEHQKTVDAYWNERKSRIDGGKIGDITIPANEKDKFFDYIATAKDNQGRSQEQIDIANEDPDTSLMLSYLRYKKLKLDDFINIRARGNKLHTARERFLIPQTPAVVTSTPANTRSNDTISLENL